MIVTGNLQELIIEGDVDMNNLLIAWMPIYEAFLDGMQDQNGRQRTKDLSTLERYKWEFELIQLCVRRMKIGRDIGMSHPQWIVDALKSIIRVDGQFNPEDQESYMRDLQVILTRSNKLQVKIKEMEAILKITDKDQQEQKAPPSFQQFDNLIAQVSLYAKFHINRDKVMTSEFIYLYKSMRAQEEYVAQELAATKAQRGHRQG